MQDPLNTHNENPLQTPRASLETLSPNIDSNKTQISLFQPLTLFSIFQVYDFLSHEYLTLAQEPMFLRLLGFSNQ